MRVTVTIEQLIQHDACSPGIDAFQKVFGRDANLSDANLRGAMFCDKNGNIYRA